MSAKSRSTLAALALGLMASTVSAYPDKPVSVIVPFAPGGSSDNVARTIGPALAEKLGQSFVIDNVSGAGGVLGTQKAVRSNADGYTVLLGSGSEILINKLINPKLPYDGTKDLAPVAMVATGPMVLLAKPDLPANTIPELIKLAHAKPGALNYGSAGNGTPMNVAGELFKMRSKSFITHIPYRGAAPALADLMGGQIDVAVSTLSAAQPHIKSGRVKALATTGAKSTNLAPEIPAMGSIRGLEGFDLNVWFGLFVPAKTPADVIQKIEAAAQQVISDPAVRKRLADQGIEAVAGSAEDLRKFVNNEIKVYAPVIKAANISAQ